jgi:bifunctional non-homologous end joining protein LigD
VRLFTRNGHDWTDRYPLIVEASLRNRSCSFIIDGEAGAARRRRHLGFQRAAFSQAQREVQLYAFDVLALDGDDLRKLPLHLRKNNLARLLARRPDGIFIRTYEQGEIGPDLFRKACEFGLEGLVSKRRDSAPAGRRAGSRSRTATTRRWNGSRSPSLDPQRGRWQAEMASDPMPTTSNCPASIER